LERYDYAEVAVVLYSNFLLSVGVRDLPIRRDDRPILFLRITPRNGQAVEEDERSALCSQTPKGARQVASEFDTTIVHFLPSGCANRMGRIRSRDHAAQRRVGRAGPAMKRRMGGRARGQAGRPNGD
jgi:hypothetical protein